MVPNNPPFYYVQHSISERGETLKNDKDGIKSEFFANSQETEVNIYSKMEIKASHAHSTKFTVEGWPESKSRSAENYVNYDEPTEILMPKRPFSSWNAGNIQMSKWLIVVK